MDIDDQDEATRLSSLPPRRPRSHVTPQQSARDYDRMFPGQIEAMAGKSCRCPRRDNAELVDTDYIWVNGDCPVHALSTKHGKPRHSAAAAQSKPIRKE